MPSIRRDYLFDDLEYKGGDGVEVEATETREFEFGNKRRRLYLTEANAAEFDASFEKYLQYAEIVPTGAAAPRARAPRSPNGAASAPRRSSGQNAKIREWAQTQEFDPPMGERGRIPAHVRTAYFAAHPGETEE